MRQGGFTLVELMVVLAVIGIIATVVVPSMQTLYNNGLNTTQTNEFVTSLNLARSEAIKRGTNVAICKSNDGANCDNDLNWHDGWIIRVSADGTVLRVHDKVSDPNVTLVGNALVANRVTYNADGTSQSGSFILCDHRGLGDHAKAIVLSFGRIRTIKQTDPSAPDAVKDAVSCNFD